MIPQDKYRQVAQEYGTPAYVFDLDEAENRVAELKKHLASNVTICYAMKANAFLAERLSKIPLPLEVCSPGELAICKQLKVRAEQIIYSGVNKQHDEVLEAIRAGVREYTCESIQQAETLQATASQEKVVISVIMRLSCGNQFGLDEKAMIKILARKKRYDHLTFIGLQYYTGTQHCRIKIIQEELSRLATLTKELNRRFDLHMRRLEYGPGLPVEYFKDEHIDMLHHDLPFFIEQVNELSKDWEIFLELGRYLASAAGTYLSKVVDVKTTEDTDYAIIDGGINHIVYTGQIMSMKVPLISVLSSKAVADDKAVTICGSLCTAADVIVRNVCLAELKTGDILAFHNIGAYSVTEGIYLFLSRKMPAVLLYSTEKGLLLKRDFIDTYQINSGMKGDVI